MRNKMTYWNKQRTKQTRRRRRMRTTTMTKISMMSKQSSRATRHGPSPSSLSRPRSTDVARSFAVAGRVACPSSTSSKKSNPSHRIHRCFSSSTRISENRSIVTDSYLTFSFRRSFRIFCHRICNHRAFGYVVLVCILFSSVSLGAEDPVDSDSFRNKVRCLFLSRWHR